MKDYRINSAIELFRNLTFLICITTLFSECNDTYEKNANIIFHASNKYHHLSSSTSLLQFSDSASTQSFSITCDGETTWELQNSAPWISISPLEGNRSSEVHISVQANYSGDTSRVAFVTLKSTSEDWNYSRRISISQSAAIPYLITEDEVLFSCIKESKALTINSNCKWTASLQSDWISITQIADNNILLTVADNFSDKYRMADLIIKTTNEEKVVTLTQSPANISASQTSIHIDNKARSFLLQIESEIGWHLLTSDSWIQATPSNGNEGLTELEIFVTANKTIKQRNGYLTIFTDDYKRVQIEIIQDAVFLQLSETLVKIPSAITTIPIVINSNDVWSITEHPDWIKPSLINGHESQLVNFHVSENISTINRTGLIKIQGHLLDLTQTLCIQQDGKAFSLSQGSLSFGVEEESQIINVISELPWTSVSSHDWIITDVNMSNSSTPVTITVAETQEEKERYGSIDYNVIDKTLSLNIHQLGKYFEISNDALSFNSKGGTSNIYISSNENWEILNPHDIDWISYSDYKGSGDAAVSITVTDNPTPQERSETVRIKTSRGQHILLDIKQEGRYLRSDVASMEFYADGGRSIITISTDGEYSLTCLDSWITTSQSSKNIWEIIIAANTEAIIRTSSIHIELTDLIDGEMHIDIPITQTYEGGVFLEDFHSKKEINWDVINDDGFTITIKSYSNDIEWNSGANTEDIIIDISNYENEQNWN